MHSTKYVAALGALALLFQTACGKPEDAGAAGKGDPSAKGGEKGGPGGMAGRGGPPAIVLGPNDVMEVHIDTIEAGIAISGDLKPLEQTDVRSRVEGNIVAVLVREGERVSQGQLLARFESSVQEGDRASAAADVESAKSEVTNAQWNADQSQELFKAGAIPERDLRTAQQALAAAQARQAAAEARLRASTQTASDTRVVAPTTGVVSARSVEPGEHVQRGATLFTVVRNDILELEASVPARQASELRIGLPVRFASGGRQLTGKVARIAPTINAASRTLLAYLQVPNRNGELLGGSFATGRIVGRTINDAIVIPTAAVHQSSKEEENFVYRIENDRVQHATVQIGITDDVAGTAQVTEGLAVGDRIIVGNVGALGRGMQVRVVNPEQQRGRDAGMPAGPGGKEEASGAKGETKGGAPAGATGNGRKGAGRTSPAGENGGASPATPKR